MSPIIDLQKRLVEVGRIRMGQKSSRGAPQKLETFRITSRDQARVTEIAGIYGGKVIPWKDRPGEFEVITTTSELPILLLPGQALSQWYELWSAGGAQRRCDGERDVISDGPCVCLGEKGARKCKPTTRLSVMLPEIPGLGVWRLESHGFYAAVELSATAGMLEQATARGQMFPARLRIDQRSQVKDGKTTRYAVPVIDIDVRLPDALGGGSLAQPVLAPVERAAITAGYTPIAAAQIGAGISAEEGLAAVARESAPRIRNARSAAPLGPAPDDIEFGSAPIPVEQPEPLDATDSTDEGAVSPGEAESAGALAETGGGSVDEAAGATAPTSQPIPPNVPPAPTKAQLGKLGVLVGKLRTAGTIETEHLWFVLAKSRSFEYEQMIELLGGRDDEGVLHWGPLLSTLTRPEASELIDRLVRLEEQAA